MKYLTVKYGKRSHKFEIKKKEIERYNKYVAKHPQFQEEIKKLWHYYLIAREFNHPGWASYWMKKLQRYL